MAGFDGQHIGNYGHLRGLRSGHVLWHWIYRYQLGSALFDDRWVHAITNFFFLLIHTWLHTYEYIYIYSNLISLPRPTLQGIGIDDTFVMLAGWRRTPAKMPVAERMGHMMSEAAVSITITSLTDLFSFWIGIISPFRSVQIFCTYSVFAVVFTFVWHITFFAGCMAISGYREWYNLHAIFGCKVQAMSVAIKGKSIFYCELWKLYMTYNS